MVSSHDQHHEVQSGALLLNRSRAWQSMEWKAHFGMEDAKNGKEWKTVFHHSISIPSNNFLPGHTNFVKHNCMKVCTYIILMLEPKQLIKLTNIFNQSDRRPLSAVNYSFCYFCTSVISLHSSHLTFTAV